MDKNYKLVGFLNMFDIIPDFVYPIFECEQDKKLYFQDEDDEDKLKIAYFVQVKDNILDIITFLDDIKHSVEDSKRQITIGSEIIFGFQIKNNEVKFGSYEYFKNFLGTFKPQNQILANEISAFFEKYYK